MTTALIDAEIQLASEQAEALRYRVRDCKSQHELDVLRHDLFKILDRIQDLTAKKNRAVADMLIENLKLASNVDL